MKANIGQMLITTSHLLIVNGCHPENASPALIPNPPAKNESISPLLNLYRQLQSPALQLIYSRRSLRGYRSRISPPTISPVGFKQPGII